MVVGAGHSAVVVGVRFDDRFIGRWVHRCLVRSHVNSSLLDTPLGYQLLWG